jgi:uncharacterized protein YjiS (DUF1127 family)
MSTMFPNTNRALANFGHGFTVWLRRGFERNELRNLGDRDLQDIGVSRREPRKDADKPFWMPGLL